MLLAIAVNTVGIGLCLYAYSRPWEWERGPLMLLRGASIVLGIALLCTLAALLLEVPEARGVFVAAAFIIIGVAVWRKSGGARRGPLTSETSAPVASEVPPRVKAPRPPHNQAGRWSSVTIRDIEHMEAQG